MTESITTIKTSKGVTPTNNKVCGVKLNTLNIDEIENETQYCNRKKVTAVETSKSDPTNNKMIEVKSNKPMANGNENVTKCKAVTTVKTSEAATVTEKEVGAASRPANISKSVPKVNNSDKRSEKRSMSVPRSGQKEVKTNTNEKARTTVNLAGDEKTPKTNQKGGQQVIIVTNNKYKTKNGTKYRNENNDAVKAPEFSVGPCTCTGTCQQRKTFTKKKIKPQNFPGNYIDKARDGKDFECVNVCYPNKLRYRDKLMRLRKKFWLRQQKKQFECERLMKDKYLEYLIEEERAERACNEKYMDSMLKNKEKVIMCCKETQHRPRSRYTLLSVVPHLIKTVKGGNILSQTEAFVEPGSYFIKYDLTDNTFKKSSCRPCVKTQFQTFSENLVKIVKKMYTDRCTLKLKPMENMLTKDACEIFKEKFCVPCLGCTLNFRNSPEKSYL